jgi:hypothetical protein
MVWGLREVQVSMAAGPREAHSTVAAGSEATAAKS